MKKILAWDDEPNPYLDLLAKSLRNKFSAEVTIEKINRHFIEKMQAGSFDLFITDLANELSPDNPNFYQGLANIKDIRQHHPEVPIMIYTGHAAYSYNYISMDKYTWMEDKSTRADFLAIRIMDILEKHENDQIKPLEKKTEKLSIFIGSASDKAKEVAEVIQQNLVQERIMAAVWKDGLFTGGKSILDNLEHIVQKFNCGVFVFHQSDIVTIKGVEKLSVRDNVIFEYGMFVGKWGIERTSIVVPIDVELQILSDIKGVVYETYNSDVDDEYLRTALAPACTNIRKQFLRQLSKHQ